MSAPERDALAAAVAELGALPMPTGEPVPVELTGQQLEALIDAGNRALNDRYHEDQCHCDDWPTSCVSSGHYFMGAWDTNAFAIGLPAVLGVWESLRNDRHATKIAELRADNERLRAENERLGNDLIGANLALWEDAREIARLLLALKAAQRGRRELRARLKAFEALELGTPEGRVSAKCEDATHPVWLRDLDDMRGCPWCRVAELEAQHAAVLALHRKHTDSEHCFADDETWPCGTRTTLGSHLGEVAPDPLAYGPTGYRCGCGKDAHSPLTPCQPMTADEWNAQHPVGTPVTAYPVTRDDEPLVTVTRSRAWALGHGAAVVAVDGYSGGICLTHVDPRPGASS